MFWKRFGAHVVAHVFALVRESKGSGHAVRLIRASTPTSATRVDRGVDRGADSVTVGFVTGGFISHKVCCRICFRFNSVQRRSVRSPIQSDRLDRRSCDRTRQQYSSKTDRDLWRCHSNPPKEIDMRCDSLTCGRTKLSSTRSVQTLASLVLSVMMAGSAFAQGATPPAAAPATPPKAVPAATPAATPAAAPLAPPASIDEPVLPMQKNPQVKPDPARTREAISATGVRPPGSNFGHGTSDWGQRRGASQGRLGSIAKHR